MTTQLATDSHTITKEQVEAWVQRHRELTELLVASVAERQTIKARLAAVGVLADAQGTEARRAETVKQGSVHDGPVPKECARKDPTQSRNR